MATRMQQRRGTAAQWVTLNSGNGPILAAGEIGFESDTNKFKIGDGINHWVDLVYFTDAAGATQAISDLIAGAPAALDTLNELAAAINDDPNFFSTIATNLSNHESDSTNVHGIANTADLATKTYVNTAVGNIDLSTKQDKVSGVSNTEIGYLDGVTSKIQDQLDGKASSSDLSTHASDTTSVHGIADTSLLVTTTGTQTLSSKTLTSPTIDTNATLGITSGSNMFFGTSTTGTAFAWDSGDGAYATKLTISGSSSSDGDYLIDGSVSPSGSFTLLDALPSEITGGTYPGGTTFIFKTGGTISSTEIGYLDGVTSRIQSQLNTKASLSGTETLSNKTLMRPTVISGVGTQGNVSDFLTATVGEYGVSITTSGNTAFDTAMQAAIAYYQANGTPPSLVFTGTNNSLINNIQLDIGAGMPGSWELYGTAGFPGTSGQFSIGSGGMWVYRGGSVTISETELGYLDGVTSNIQTQLNSKLESSDLSGYATESYVTTAIGNVIDSAPSALDTLNELAAALGDDANYAATITTSLGLKAPLESPTFTGTVSGITKSMVGLGNVENTALSTWAGTSNITTLGTVTTGTWNGTAIGATKGGTGLTSYTTGDMIYASGSNTLSKLSAGTDGYLLTMASGVPTWAAAPATGPTAVEVVMGVY